MVDAEDDGSDLDENLVGACHNCHERYSAQQSQQRAVKSAWDWKRRPEQRPNVVD